MFTKAGLLIAVFLVFMGYRWGTRRVAASRSAAQPAPQAASQATTQAASTSPKREIFSLKLLLGVVIVLLIIAILTSLQR